MNANAQNQKFWHLSWKEIANLLGTHGKDGLSEEEAKNRLVQFGKNVMPSSPKTARIKILLNQFKSPLIFILLIAGIVTLAISHGRDALFIFFAVIVNVLLGFYQEDKAERALSGLRAYLKQKARVVRDGKEREIDVEEIVVGDLLRLAQGDRVPADARVILVNDFQVDEAILTGESLPVTKTEETAAESASISDQWSMVFAGTLVTQGLCSAIVCRTDAFTELGKVASLLASLRTEKTPLQTAIAKFSLFLSVVLGILTILVFTVGMFAGYALGEMFLTAVAIAVSAIPEGLPISLTVILAVGVERMAKRKGVVRRLVAAETLGSTTVILTDKTGTLTMANMVLSQILPFGADERTVLIRALANTNVLIQNPEDPPPLWRMNGRIMETALARSALLRGVTFTEVMAKDHVLQSIPFNAVQKFSVALIDESGKHILVFLGAPDILLQHASLETDKKDALLQQINSLALSGERVLGVASKEITHTQNFSLPQDLSLSHISFDGLMTFRDPLRAGMKGVIDRVGKAGIRTVILTGDHRGTAVAVARELGMQTDAGSVLDASELVRFSDDALRARLANLSVISRVTPADKARLVKLFQESGEVVAMTGDGVNDAPSMKQADVGIAMGSGTEVARSVADVVLLDDNFETIVAAIEEGRRILANIRKVLVYFLSTVTDELVLIGGSLFLGFPLPLTALQILWVNFFADSFPAVAFAFEKQSDGFRFEARKRDIALFNPLTKFLILGIGLSTTALLFVTYILLLRLGYPGILVRTFIFAAFGTYTLFMAFSVRNLDKSILSYPLFSNKRLTGAVGIGVSLMAAAIYIPDLQALFGTIALPPLWVIGVFLIGIINIVLVEGAKRYFYKQSVLRT